MPSFLAPGSTGDVAGLVTESYREGTDLSIGKSNSLFHRPRPPTPCHSAPAGARAWRRPAPRAPPTLASPPPGRARGAPRHRAPPRVAGHGQDGWLGTGCQRGWGGWRQGKISIAVLLCGLGNKLKARSLNFGRHPGRGFDGETRLTGKAMMWDKTELPR
jgi:hypothetical protein